MPQHPGLVPYPKDLDYKNQSIELPGTRKPGQTGIYRNAAFPDLLDYNSEQAHRNVVEIFQSGLSHSPDGPCLGHRPIVSKNPLKFAPQYSWLTYSQVDQRRRNLGSALEFLWQQGRAGAGGDLPTVGLWSQNRPEWQIVDLAVQAYAKVSVSLYDSLGPDAVEYICSHADVTIVFVAGAQLPSILALGPRLKKLKVVCCFDELNDEAKHVSSAWAAHRGLELFTLQELEALGKANYQDPIPPNPEQIYSISYTSGTTGDPKGVILRHGQTALASCSGIRGMTFTEPGAVLSYLPLAHIYERLVELSAFELGGAIGYFTGDPLRLLEDCQILRPTWFPAVPRVLNRIYQTINASGDVPGLKGNIFRKAVAVKLANFHATGEVTHPFWDRIVFRKVRSALGGQVEALITGSAPISKDVVDFLRIAFSCNLYEGIYGMTETTAIGTKTLPNDPSSGGTVGPPQPGSEIKLVDVPSMGYTSQDRPRPRGEVCFRGPVNLPSYYKDPKNTAAALDAEGWLHSGDIAEIDDCGRFKIVDRIKNIMKLSQGEYVALEKIESAYGASPMIAQIYVHGDSLQNHLVAVIVPEPVHLAAIVSKSARKHVRPEDVATLQEFTDDERVVKVFTAELAKQARHAGLKSFECVKAIHISLELFSTENNTLTPTLKIKRREAQVLYKDVLEALYRQPVDSMSSTLSKL